MAARITKADVDQLFSELSDELRVLVLEMYDPKCPITIDAAPLTAPLMVFIEDPSPGNLSSAIGVVRTITYACAMQRPMKGKTKKCDELGRSARNCMAGLRLFRERATAYATESGLQRKDSAKHPHDTVVAIKKHIDEQPGQTAMQLAIQVKCTEAHVRRLVSKKLKQLGYTNSRGGAGYFPPNVARS